MPTNVKCELNLGAPGAPSANSVRPIIMRRFQQSCELACTSPLQDNYSRKDKTQLINQCIVRTDGRWSLQLDTQILKVVRERRQQELLNKSLVTKPTIMCHHLFGGELAYKQALELGQVWDNGNGTSTYKEGEHVHSSSKSKHDFLEGTKKQLSSAEQAYAATILDIGGTDFDDETGLHTLEDRTT